MLGWDPVRYVQAKGKQGRKRYSRQKGHRASYRKREKLFYGSFKPCDVDQSIRRKVGGPTRGLGMQSRYDTQNDPG